MRATLDVYNLNHIYGAEFNQIPFWPHWYPGAGWVDSRKIPIHTGLQWLASNWTISVYFSAIYLFGIWAGQRYMKDQKPYDLKGPLIVWNLALSVFSAMGSYVLIPVVVHTLWTRGYTALVCDIPTYKWATLLFWAQLFTWSKVAEFGDTAFLVARKRPVLRLHWIHHSVTCMLTFLSTRHPPAVCLQLGAVNFAIHTVMYAYYAARAAGLRVPLRWAKWITRIQITQMLADLTSFAWAYYVMEWTDRPCYIDPSFVYAGLLTLLVFTGLFVNYFVKSYCKVRVGNSAEPVGRGASVGAGSVGSRSWTKKVSLVDKNNNELDNNNLTQRLASDKKM